MSSETILSHQRTLEQHISLIDQQIERLVCERDKLIQDKIQLVQEIERRCMRESALGQVPVEYIVQFCEDIDVSRFSKASWYCKQASSDSAGLAIVPHIGKHFNKHASEEAMWFLARNLCGGSVKTLSLDARSEVATYFLEGLIKEGKMLSGVEEISINAAADSGAFVDLVSTLFINHIPFHTVKRLHLQGLRSIASVGVILSTQNFALEHLKVDYFVSGHENDILEEELPTMPRIRSLVYDVADVTELNAGLLYKRLTEIEDLPSVERIYLPHVQISGDSADIVRVVLLLELLSGTSQIVLRFSHLPFSVKEIVGLRTRTLSHLPAVCISDHFIVAMSSWADWWPKMTEVWPSPSRITGLSVFREQIDFEALGTNAVREWLRLSKKKKAMWESMIAPHVSKLYMSTVAGAEKLEETTDQSSGPLSISAPISEGDAEIEELSSSDSFFD